MVYRHWFLQQLAASIALAGAVGCGTPSTGSESFSSVPGSEESSGSGVGSVGFNLDVASSQIDAVKYDISGNHFQKTGTIDVSQSPRVSAVIAGVPFGSGYAATLTADSVQGPKLSCLGSANFDVTSADVTPVEVKITCQETPTVPVPRGAIVALGAILLASGMSLLRGEKGRRLSRT
jgi:hypothetical protein